MIPAMMLREAITFQPTDIVSLQLWLDGSDATKLYTDAAKTTLVSSDNDVVGAMEDKSGNGNDATQSTTANKPLYKTGIQNGKSVVRFDGINDLLRTAAFSSDLAQPNTLFLVAKAIGLADALIDGIVADKRNFIARANATVYTVYAGNSRSVGTPGSIFHVIVILYSGASSDAWVDSVNKTISGDGDLGSNSISGMTVGANYFGTAPADADVGEVLFYDSALSTADRQSVEAYLNNKWSIY